MRVRIATRGSDLALWQARHVAAALAREPGVECELVVLKTRGDVIDDVPLQTIEGKGFFTAEIERALLAREADLAVHSHKDLAVEGPPGLRVVAVPARAPAAERLLVQPHAFRAEAPFLPLADGARVGTSAPRRREQLAVLRPDLELLDLRGNVPTRVARLREGRYDAIVLAAAGLERLELDLADLCVETLGVSSFVPAPAQGALALQAREDDAELIELCRRRLHDEGTALAVEAERSLLVAVGGGCNLPLGAHVEAVESARHPAPDHPGGPTGAPDGDGSNRVSFRASVFLGAGHPRPGAPARWAAAEGPDALAAVRAAQARLFTCEPTGDGPLAGLEVAITGSGDGPSLLEQRLAVLGATARTETVLEFEPLESAPAVLAELSALRPGATVVITSRRAAAALAGWRRPSGVRLAAVGPACARALEELGLAVDLVGSGGARELARALEPGGGRILYPCAEDARRDLEEGLAARGAVCERLPLYRTRARADVRLSEAAAARIYMSPSAVRASAGWERAHASGTTRRLALGDSARAALAEAGLEAELPARSANLQEAAVRHLAGLARATRPERHEER